MPIQLNLFQRIKPLEERLADYAVKVVAHKNAMRLYTAGKLPTKPREPIAPRDSSAPFAFFDLESKADESQRRGFERVFLVGFYDGAARPNDAVPLERRSKRRQGSRTTIEATSSTLFVAWRNEAHLDRSELEWRERAITVGGCIDAFLRHALTERYDGYRFYGWNSGRFDVNHLLAWFRRAPNDSFFDVEVVQQMSSVVALHVRSARRTKHKSEHRPKWLFLDAKKLIPFEQNEAAKTFGVARKVETDLDMHERDTRWVDRVRGDVEGGWQIMSRVHELVAELGGVVEMTTAATSMRLFRMRYMGGPAAHGSRTPVKIQRNACFSACIEKRARYAQARQAYEAGKGVRPQKPAAASCEGCMHDWVRRGFYGGRVEIFAVQGEGLRYVDINSSYASVLRGPMPYGRAIEREDYDREMHASGYAGFVECTVHVPETLHVPPLPHRFGKALVFPVGTFSGVWSTAELALLEELGGGVISTRRAVYYPTKSFFREFVERLWAYRDKSRPDYNEGLSQLAKLMVNAVFGKTGMRPDRETTLFENRADPTRCIVCPRPADPRRRRGETRFCEIHREAERQGRLVPVAGVSSDAFEQVSTGLWSLTRRSRAQYIAPQIAAWVTSLGRVKLYRDILANPKVERLYYCDTDSGVLEGDLEVGTELGALKDEYPGVRLRGAFAQPKCYVLEDIDKGDAFVKMKGVSREKRTRETFERFVAGETISSEGLQQVGTLRRRGFRSGPQLVTRTKSMRTAYWKRLVMTDGTTTPLVFADDKPTGETLEWLVAKGVVNADGATRVRPPKAREATGELLEQDAAAE